MEKRNVSHDGVFWCNMSPPHQQTFLITHARNTDYCCNYTHIHIGGKQNAVQRVGIADRAVSNTAQLNIYREKKVAGNKREM